MNCAARPGHHINKFHDDELQAIGFLNVDHRTDIGMIQRSGGFCFLQETGFLRIIGGKMLRQEFECYNAIELRVLGLIDHTHPALSKFLKNLIVGYYLTYHNPIFPSSTPHILAHFGYSRNPGPA